MFSFFNGGITSLFPKRHIDFPSLIMLIRNNPEKIKIEKVRELRNSNLDYSTSKSYLPYITPNCLVRKRNLNESDYNLITLSSYIYFDIDDYPNSLQLKERFIVEYGHLASLICISCSGGGISILFKISNKLNSEIDFLIARQHILDTILLNENIDINAGGIARAMFISYDPNLYYNIDNQIDIPNQLLKKKKYKFENCLLENKNTKLSKVRCDYASQKSFIPVPIKEVLDNLIFETPVDVDNPVVDYKEVDYVEIRFKYLIKDTLKHKTFTSMIHKLLFLNPSADKNLILSYLYHINEEHTGYKKMELRELISLFETVYNGITVLGNSRVKTIKKRIHYNKNCDATVNKRKLSGKIRGILKENETKLKIRAAIEDMDAKGLPITKSMVSKRYKISRGSVIKHWNSDLHDVDLIINQINDSIE
jgi:hypothetical protein